mgnify:CR=1 FL=1
MLCYAWMYAMLCMLSFIMYAMYVLYVMLCYVCMLCYAMYVMLCYVCMYAMYVMNERRWVVVKRSRKKYVCTFGETLVGLEESGEGSLQLACMVWSKRKLKLWGNGVN